MREFSEREIILKIKQGEINYFEFFVKKYSGIALRFAVKKTGNIHDAEDIVQNSFIKIYKAMDRLDENQQFYDYFFSILKNELIEFFRKKRKTEPLPDNLFSPENNSYLTYSFFDKLKLKHKQVLQLYADGYSYEEIAKKLKKPINTVKTLIRRARLEAKKYAKNI